MEWHGDEFIKNLEQQLGDNLEKAAIYLKDRVKEAVNQSQPYERYIGENGVYYKGDDPSEPGEAPKKITGTLQRSITHKMSTDRQHAYVGSNLDYAYYLEFGTSKMAARPFLRSTLIEEADAIAKIVTTGKQ